ncbi:MAG: YgeY family selenium metabolism-linked hydrolase [Chloroflexi bacterium]|nr:YgeY family selenium metabolism-linked hydrolase [Chloroflexota bacterium]
MLSKAQQDRIVTFAQEIIRINSLSGQEKSVAEAISAKMRALDYDQVSIDPYGSVTATRKGLHAGPRILFDAHMDVVEVQDPELWSVDPFSGVIRDGKIWGRGASDMKGPLAAAVVTLGIVPRSEIHGTVIMSTSVNEEKHEGAALAKVIELTRPDFVVICEPNGACLGIGQKGRAGITLDVRGVPAHSSVPNLGENAILKACRVMQRLEEMPLPKDDILGDAIMVLIDGISRPYPSRSTIPVEFFMHYDRRLVQHETQDSVMEQIHNGLKDLPDWNAAYQQIKLPTYTGLEMDEIDFHPAWVMDGHSTWMEKAKLGLRKAGIEPVYGTAKFCTNGSYSAGVAGIPTMIFGPSSGMLAHCRNEHIEIAELLQGAEGYWGLASELGK